MQSLNLMVSDDTMSQNNELPPIDKYDGAAHMYPCDLEEMKTGEMFRDAFSIPVGSPTHGRSVPLFTEKYVQDYARAALAAQAASLSKTVECDAQAGLSLTRDSQAVQVGQSEAVAKVTNKFGDPVSFAVRELSVLVDIQKLPIGTKIYTHPVPVRQPLTDEEMDKTIHDCPHEDFQKEGWILRQRRIWGRAVEAAHGITAQGCAHD